MDDKGSVGKFSVSSDSVSTLNSEDFVLVSRVGDETPSSTNNGSDDEKTGLKVRKVGANAETKRLSLVDFLVFASVATISPHLCSLTFYSEFRRDEALPLHKS